MRVSFRTKLFLAFFMANVLLAGAVIAYFFVFVRDVPTSAIRSVLVTAVSQGAERLEPLAVERIVHAPDTAAGRRMPLYVRLREVLGEIERATPRFSDRNLTAEPAGLDTYEKDVYLLAPTPREGEVRVVASLNDRRLGTVMPLNDYPAIRRGWASPAGEQDPGEDRFSGVFSAYAPIKSPSGRTIAVLGIDAPTSFVRALNRRVLVLALAAFLAALLVSSVVALYVSGRVNHPIGRLHAGMTRLASGDLDVRLPVLRTRDEIEDLLGHFNRMVNDLRDGAALKLSLALASDVQRHLLPESPPSVAGYDIAAGAAFCDDTGGDYYDFIDLGTPTGEQQGSDSQPAVDPSRSPLLGVAIGDVSGHGIGPALLMAWTRGVLRVLAPSHALRVGDLLEDVNRHLLRDARDGRFMTLFYAVLDPRPGRLAWVSAGHEPAFWYRAASGSVEQLHSTSVPLGVSGEFVFEPGPTIELQPGDVVLITTDGVSQARDLQNTYFGFDRLGRLLKDCAGDTAEAIRTRVVREVEAHGAGRPIDDDVTVVVIKANPSASPHP